MSDKSKIKKNQNKDEKNPKYKAKPFKENAKAKRIPQNERPIQRAPPPAPSKTADENTDDGAPPVDMNNPFPNLRRETDEILIITGKPNSKFSKREIKSNWPEFELPPEDFETAEESFQGADFETLLRTPMSLGSHFQFKHEKTWTHRKESNQYADLFGLDSKVISDALSCIPFYERNRLDPSLFTKEQAAKMKNTANRNKANFDKNLPILSLENEISINIINKFGAKTEMERSNSESEEVSLSHSVKDFNEGSQIKSVSNVINSVLPAKLEKVALNDDDDELDMLLENVLQPVNSNIKLPSMSSDGNVSISIPKVLTGFQTTPQSPKVNAPPEVDLDKWLDDYLES